MPPPENKNWFPVVSSPKKKRFITLNLTMRIDWDLIQDRVQNLSKNRETRQDWGETLYYSGICRSSSNGPQNYCLLLAAIIYKIDTSGSYRMCIVSQIATHLSVSGPNVLHALLDNAHGAYSEESRNNAYINTSHALTRTWIRPVWNSWCHIKMVYLPCVHLNATPRRRMVGWSDSSTRY